MNNSPYSEYITVYTKEEIGKKWEANPNLSPKVLTFRAKGKNGGTTCADGAWVYPLKIVADQYDFLMTGVQGCFFLRKKPFVHDFSI